MKLSQLNSLNYANILVIKEFKKTEKHIFITFFLKVPFNFGNNIIAFCVHVGGYVMCMSVGTHA